MKIIGNVSDWLSYAGGALIKVADSAGSTVSWNSHGIIFDNLCGNPASLLSIMCGRAAGGGGKPGHISASWNVPVKPPRWEGDSQATYFSSGI